jgi:hypothetical protein
VRWRNWSDVRFVSEVGMDPVNWFPERSRVFMPGNLLPMSIGMLPLSILTCICNISNEDKLYRETGGSPERLLKASVRSWRCLRAPRLVGMVPWSWLNARSRALNDDKFANDVGMEPVRLLFLRSRNLRLVSLLPNSEGTRPLSWFQPSSTIIRLVQELRLVGRGPEKALRLKLRVRRWRRRPRLAGMLPLSPLELRLRILKDDRFPTAGERTPVSPWDGRLKATT